jgi:hypothetical protein
MKHEDDMTDHEQNQQPGETGPTDQTEVHTTSDFLPTQVVTPAPGTSARRWGIALVVVALVIGVAAAGAFLLAGSSSPSVVLAYAPKDAVAYVDARLDLPGDQRQKVGDLLSRFPGFADQSTLEAKLDDVLDRLIDDATAGDQRYTSDIKPWFGGEIGLAIGSLPDAAAAESGNFADARALALVSVSDAAGARAWFDDVVGDTPTETETYGGTELVLAGSDPGGAMAIVDGKVMLLGDVASVKAAIDGGGTGGLDTNEQFKAARAATTGDHLASFYVDTAAWVDWLEQAGTSFGEITPGLGFLGSGGAQAVPAWTAGRVRSDGDALVVDLVTPHVDGAATRSNRVSTIASRVPADTLLVVDIHDAGTQLGEFVDTVRTNPETADAFREIETAVAILGGFDGLIGWIGDAGLVVAGNGADLGGGLVVSATDEAAAERFASTLGGLLAIGGAQLGVEIREEDYNGTTITFVDVSAAVEGGGLDGGLGAEVPEIGWAVAGDVVVIGVGEPFIKAVIDTTPDTSLASTDRFATLADRVGRENISAAWVDLVGLRALVESMGAEAPGGLAEYERDIKPYLEPFDALVCASVAGDGVDRTTIVLSVE